MSCYPIVISHFFFFFFNDTATTEIYTLSLHDALPISWRSRCSWTTGAGPECRSTSGPARGCPRRPPRSPSSSVRRHTRCSPAARRGASRSEEHTSELQSRQYLVCRLLLEKKKNITHIL